MSKSLGNGIDPLEVIDKYGADALRFTLANGNSPGNDMRYSDKKVEASRNFANKLWNAARFILMNLDGSEQAELPEELALEDKWVLLKLNTLSKEVCENLDKYEIGIAAANQATKNAAATANGLTGLFGYASTVVSGVGLGYVAQHYGWNWAYVGILGMAVVGMLVFLLMWGARADGYDAEPEHD